MLKLSAQIRKFTKYYLCSGNFQWQRVEFAGCECNKHSMLRAWRFSFQDVLRKLLNSCVCVCMYVCVYGLSSLNFVIALSLSPSLSCSLCVCVCYIVILYNANIHSENTKQPNPCSLLVSAPCLVRLEVFLCLCANSHTKFEGAICVCTTYNKHKLLLCQFKSIK